MKKFLRHPQLRFPRKKRRESRRQDLGGNHEHQPVGHLDEAAMGQDVGLAIGIIRSDQLIAQTERTAEIGSPRLFRNEGIGTGFDKAAVDKLGSKNSAQARRGFVQNIFEFCARLSLFFEREGCRQSGDTSTDNGDALHRAWLLAPGFRLPDATGSYSCTNRARFFTLSTGVSGRMP